ncbi:hypothetical protein FN3523_1007 [Francisella hispaniensis]|uniref:Phage tail fibre protein N-terminal domain-containing protein n=2 Tax=Francisella hispaniensis TaxID=622488 RepID=F4BFR6_9GAMM|nr:hypothetical protein FN3523_1007 [Francisella hispaniensis]
MLDKLAFANINGDSIVISDYSVTDSSVNDESTVGNIIHSDSITSTQDDPNNINTIIVKVVIPSSVNSNNTVRKIYLYDQDGDVFGYGLVPPFTLSANNNIEAELNFYITNSNISTVTITTASMTYVTQDMLDDALANDIPNATETIKGIAQIATNADVDAKIDDTKIVTVAKCERAIDNRIATDAEVLSGNVTNKFVTPQTLNNYKSLGQDWQAAELVNTGAVFSDGAPKYRQIGVTYTNTTARSIVISFIATAQSTSNDRNAIISSNIFVDGIVIGADSSYGYFDDGIVSHFSAIVPSGSTYLINCTFGASTINQFIEWSELR